MILQDLNRKAPETTVKWIKEVDGGQVNFIHFELNVQCVSGPVSFNKFDLTLFLRADAVSTGFIADEAAPPSVQGENHKDFGNEKTKSTRHWRF
jgi:hypothetical protein